LAYPLLGQVQPFEYKSLTPPKKRASGLHRKTPERANIKLCSTN